MINVMKIYPNVWGFRWIQNVIAGGKPRGISLYLGRWQIALQSSDEVEH